MTEAIVGRRERKKEETRRRIFDAAVKLFTDKGFEATTIDDIAERADVAKGTFFNYFPRKEAVLHFLLEEWEEMGQAYVADTSRSAEERLKEMFIEAATSFGATRDMATLAARLSLQTLCAPLPETADVQRRLEACFEAVWRQGVEAGEFRDDIEPKVAHGVLGSIFVGAVTWWVGSPDGRVDPEAMRYTLPELMRQNFQLVFDGLRRRGV